MRGQKPSVVLAVEVKMGSRSGKYSKEARYNIFFPLKLGNRRKSRSCNVVEVNISLKTLLSS